MIHLYRFFIILICKQFFSFRHRLPIDWKSDWYGYSAAVIIEFSCIAIQFLIAVTALGFLLGSNILLAAFVEDIKQELNSMNNNWKVSHNREKLAKDLRDIIQIHVEAKQSVISIQK